MPSVNLGTCCGSDPKVGIRPWFAAGGTGIDTAWDYRDQTIIAGILKTSAKVSRGFTAATPVENPLLRL